MMAMRSLCLLAVLALVCATAHARPPVRYRMLYGLEPTWLSTDLIRVEHGTCADSSGTVEMRVTPAEHGGGIVLDIRGIGLGGRDGGAAVDGWYYVYMTHKSSDDSTGAMFSRAPGYGGVILPPGVDALRKLPYAVYREAGRFRRYRILSWPRAHIDYTEFTTSGQFAALIGGASTSWTVFSLARLVPPNSDTANVSIFAANITGEGAKSAFLKPIEPGSGGSTVATVSALQGFDTGGYSPLTMDSAQQAFYTWNAPGGWLMVLVKGFYVTEGI
jgi:hypothetical protein